MALWRVHLACIGLSVRSGTSFREVRLIMQRSLTLRAWLVLFVSVLMLASCSTDRLADTPEVDLDIQASAFTSTLVAKHSGKCLVIKGDSTSNGAAAEQRDCDDSEATEFRFVPVSGQSDVYTIRNVKSDKCLDVFRAKTERGTELVQYSCGEGDNQHFKLIKVTGDYYQLEAQHSEQCVDVFRALKADGTKVVQYTCAKEPQRTQQGNQLWRVQRNVAPPPPPPPPSGGLERLKVNSSGRYLQTVSGDPFFPVADTMWGLRTLTESQVDTYFKERKREGFNTILGPVVWGNEYGVPGVGSLERPSKDNEAHYAHLDMIVEKAEQYGLYLVFVTNWTEHDNASVMKLYGTDKNAEDYMTWLGNRYKKYPNIMWSLVGEYSLDVSYVNRVKAMGRGLQRAVGDSQLISVHPAGGAGFNKQSSADYFKNESWLDLNMIQTWRDDDSTWKKTAADLKNDPSRPTWVSETKYVEDGADAYRMRRNAYWSAMSGSLGFGHGHDGVWRGTRPGYDPRTKKSYNWNSVLRALDDESGPQMGYLHNLVMSRAVTPSGQVALFDFRPDLSIVKSSNPENAYPDRGDLHIAALRDTKGRTLMVYIPTKGSPRTVKVDIGKATGQSARFWWFNPSNGASDYAGITGLNGSSQVRTFKTPAGSDDWVLVVDSSDAKWEGRPGE